MSSVKEIESAVARLSRQDLASFRSWFADFDAEAWDRQFEADAAAGRLDALGDEALQDLEEERGHGCSRAPDRSSLPLLWYVLDLPVLLGVFIV